ncbi:MAG: tRNA pseudouridine(38-40) synthase TruA [Kiritimatiellaeota bacterium]|nr:tRNA pseudouridine(38-40) synthase TruA [Kiritimatiellota bacterium]
MTRFKLTIAYDGTAYNGWQVQATGIATVQKTCEDILSDIFHQPVKLHGSGRTDRGVHASGQVAHFDAETRMKPKAILNACNARFPADIRVLRATRCAKKFHARFGAKRKEYRYFAWNDAVIPPDKRLYHAHAMRPLDLAAMRAAAAHFVGEHDFASFTANPQREVKTTVREIYACVVSKSGKRICIRVQGSGFLYKQVRSIAGFILRVGEGNEQPDAALALLDAAEPRTARVPSAPPQGLFLWRVWYSASRVTSSQTV